MAIAAQAQAYAANVPVWVSHAPMSAFGRIRPGKPRVGPYSEDLVAGAAIAAQAQALLGDGEANTEQPLGGSSRPSEAPAA
jgi:hypothetical protein